MYLTYIVRLMYIRTMHLSVYMAKQNLRDKDVADAIGKSRVSVSRWRRRLTRPDWEAAEAIKAYSGGKVSADDWLTEPTLE